MAVLDYQNRDDAQKEGGLLRKLFGPSKKEIWGQLADLVSGQFVNGGFLGRDKVVATTDHWSVTLDTYTVQQGRSSTTYTRMRAPYVNKDGFRFKIYRASFFTSLGEMLGMHDIKIGVADFDETFVIKSNSEEKVRALLADQAIRALIDAQPRIRFEVKDDEGWFSQRFPEGVDELYFLTGGVIKDLERLQALFELFAAILHRLCHIGSAYEDDPGIIL